jgi:hypothetical protein
MLSWWLSQWPSAHIKATCRTHCLITFTWIGTLERLVPGVSVDVMVELGTCHKTLAAVGAGQLGLGVVVLQVVVQAVLLRVGSVADPDPGSGAFLSPGSGIRDPGWVESQHPDPG